MRAGPKGLGAKSRKAGGLFELKVRKKFEKKGWIIDKFSNNIDLDEGKFVAAKNKYIPGRGLMPGLGFPDFVMFKIVGAPIAEQYKLVFIECKLDIKRLTKLEKQKLDWMVKQGHRCFTAHDNDGEIEIREFLEYKEQKKVR
jgi:hypothetical protein